MYSAKRLSFYLGGGGGGGGEGWWGRITPGELGQTKRHWCVISDRNPLKYIILDIDHLNYFIHEHENKQWKLDIE